MVMKKYPLLPILKSFKLLTICLMFVLTIQTSVKAQALQPIISGEYFLDADPGFGNATSITVNSSTTVDLNTITISFANLSEGIHYIYVRFKDNLNRWGLPIRKPFYVVTNFNNPSPIVAAEFFIDEDPGFENATNIPITSGTLVDTSVDLSYQNLSEGTHFLYLRVKNEEGKWSLAAKREFTVTALSSDTFQMKKNVVYPNPFSEVLNIDLDDSLTIHSLELFDSLGKKVSIPNLENNQIQLTGLPIGIYILSVSTIDNQKFLFKVCK